MKKLMFVPSLALASIIAGCSTELVDSNGNPVRDSNGNTVMVSTETKERVQKSSTVVRETVKKDIEAQVKKSEIPAGASTVTIPDSQLKTLAGAGATE